MRVFSRYLAIGVLNTAVHWSVFFCVFYLLGGSQLVSNISAFCLAVTFSFLMNARFTFRQSATSKRYIIYIIFMGAVSILFGSISAFCLAVTFSFLMNARFTFRQSATSKRYIIYIIFMGAVSILFGSISDHFNATPILTLMLFSVFSLGFGFLYSRYIVFR